MGTRSESVENLKGSTSAPATLSAKTSRCVKHMRRFTRLTNAFSKKLENHIAAISLHFMYYNFCRTHQSLRITPAMAAGATDRAWDIADIVGLLDAIELAEAQDRVAKRERAYESKGPALGFPL